MTVRSLQESLAGLTASLHAFRFSFAAASVIASPTAGGGRGRAGMLGRRTRGHRLLWRWRLRVRAVGLNSLIGLGTLRGRAARRLLVLFRRHGHMIVVAAGG